MRKSNPEGDRLAAAVDRLEQAADELAAVAGERAAGYVEQAAERLKREAPRGEYRYEYHAPNHAYRYEYRVQYPAWLWSDKPRSRKLYRDKKDGKILGVCAGLARYYGLETWIVRCLAVTALIFFNWVAFVTYVVAAFILDVGPRGNQGGRHTAGSRANANLGASRQRGQPPSHRHQLREVHADFDEIELRLRRIESHVTSGQYELQQELAKIGRTP